MIYYQNVRGLGTKYNELRLSANKSGFEMHLLTLTETWLNESIPSNMILDSDSYNIYRCDRSSPHNKIEQLLSLVSSSLSAETDQESEQKRLKNRSKLLID